MSIIDVLEQKHIKKYKTTGKNKQLEKLKYSLCYGELLDKLNSPKSLANRRIVEQLIEINIDDAYKLTPKRINDLQKKIQQIVKDTTKKLYHIDVNNPTYTDILSKLDSCKVAFDFLECIRKRKQKIGGDKNGDSR